MVATMTTGRTFNFGVKLNGAPIAPEIASAIEEIVVDENLHLPAMATVRLHVSDPAWLEGTVLAEGQRMEITANEQGTPKKLFLGNITAIEPDLSERMPLLTLRAYDLSYKLHRVRHRRSFIQVTDSDLVRKLAGEAGLSAAVDATSEVYEYVFQNNQSNFEFLYERARRIGFDLYVEDDTLYFKRPFQTRGPRTVLEWGVNLKRFRPRTTVAEPASEVIVKSWDPKAKRGVVGRASSPNGVPRLGKNPNGAQLAAQVWGAAKYTVTDMVARTQAEADAIATAHMNELGGSYIEAEGECDGAVDVRPGREVEIKRVGPRFSITYLVSAATHIFTADQGHRTHFTINQRRAGTVSELLNGTRPRALIHGPVVGLVTNINDPEQKGRVKVKFPWLADEDESHWARIASPLSGPSRGFHFLPEINDEVLVVFEHGDINHPYIIGNLYNGKDAPPVPPSLPGGRDDKLLQGGNDKVKNRLIKSTKANMLIFNDSDGAPGVFLVGSSGAYVMVDDENGKEKIALTDKTRKDFIEIRSEDKSIHIECEGDVVIVTQANLKATVKGNATVDVTGNLSATVQGNIEAKAQGNIDVQATGNVTIKATGQANIEATGPLSLKGATVTMEGQGPVTVKGAVLDLEGSGPATLKGALVNIQGAGPVAVSGTPIKLN